MTSSTRQRMFEPDPIETEIALTVPDGYRDDARLDQYLTSFLPNASRNRVQRGIREGRVRVNDRVARRASQLVRAGDTIVCRLLRPPPMDILPEPIPLDIVFEDEHLLVVNKAAGMVVHPAYGHRSGTLVHALLHHVGAGAIRVDGEDDEEAGIDDDADPLDPETDGDAPTTGLSRMEGSEYADIRPGIVHRLDKDTSGLLVVAKSEEAHTRLARQFADRTTRRRYLALVWGVPDPPTREIEGAIGRDTRDRKRMAVVPEERGKFARTHLTVTEPFEYTALCAFRLETGRTHQIRVHARHVGHPIVGDETYGGMRIVAGPDSGRRRAYWRNLFEAMPRQALHAETLGFRHPVLGTDMDFTAPVPSDMQAAIDRLRSGDPG